MSSGVHPSPHTLALRALAQAHEAMIARASNLTLRARRARLRADDSADEMILAEIDAARVAVERITERLREIDDSLGAAEAHAPSGGRVLA